jgi:hypothetical protein
VLGEGIDRDISPLSSLEISQLVNQNIEIDGLYK